MVTAFSVETVSFYQNRNIFILDTPFLTQVGRYFVNAKLIYNVTHIMIYLCIREEVGQNQKQSDKHSHSSWNYFWINQKTYSSYDYQYSTGHMIFYNECHWISRQFKLNAKYSWHVGRFSRCSYNLAVTSRVDFDTFYSIQANLCFITSTLKLRNFKIYI